MVGALRGATANTVSDINRVWTGRPCGACPKPFSTTKEIGHRHQPGSGATVYGIVKSHAACASRPGQGTTFTIYLPSADNR
jgi:hypothetical protein